jgi:hypothetical protein
MCPPWPTLCSDSWCRKADVPGALGAFNRFILLQYGHVAQHSHIVLGQGVLPPRPVRKVEPA